jgi:hypothetical protein
VKSAQDQSKASALLVYQHASAEDYLRGIRAGYPDRRHLRHLLRFREVFVQRYPDLRDWFNAPLSERVGRLQGEGPYQATCRVSYKARPYLLFLALHGYIQLDCEWIIAIRNVQLEDLIERIHVDVGLEQLIEEAVALGYSPSSARTVLRWAVSRLLLYTGQPLSNRFKKATWMPFSMRQCASVSGQMLRSSMDLTNSISAREGRSD